MIGKRCQVTDLSDIEQKGSVTQHTKKSYSRSYLEGCIEEVNKKLDDDKPTLTFMKFAGRLKNGITELYYGNSESSKDKIYRSLARHLKTKRFFF